MNLPEEPDAGNLQVRFCEGPEPTDIGLKSCGTVGKPGGKQRKQTSTYSIGRNRSTRLKILIGDDSPGGGMDYGSSVLDNLV